MTLTQKILGITSVGLALMNVACASKSKTSSDASLLGPVKGRIHVNITPDNLSSTDFYQAHALISNDEWVIQISGGNYNYQEAAKAQGTLIYFKDIEVGDFEIEFDLKSVQMNSWGNNYVGLAFWIQDERRYELLYHRISFSGLPNAIKSLDVIDGVDRWWVREEAPYVGRAVYPQDDWFRTKVVVRRNTLSAAVNSQVESLNAVPLHGGYGKGRIGFWAWPGSGVAHVRNINIKHL